MRGWGVVNLILLPSVLKRDILSFVSKKHLGLGFETPAFESSHTNCFRKSGNPPQARWYNLVICKNLSQRNSLRNIKKQEFSMLLDVRSGTRRPRVFPTKVRVLFASRNISTTTTKPRKDMREPPAIHQHSSLHISWFMSFKMRVRLQPWCSQPDISLISTPFTSEICAKVNDWGRFLFAAEGSWHARKWWVRLEKQKARKLTEGANKRE